MFLDSSHFLLLPFVFLLLSFVFSAPVTGLFILSKFCSGARSIFYNRYSTTLWLIITRFHLYAQCSMLPHTFYFCLLSFYFCLPIFHHSVVDYYPISPLCSMFLDSSHFLLLPFVFLLLSFVLLLLSFVLLKRERNSHIKIEDLITEN
jgi:hypothetical protein